MALELYINQGSKRLRCGYTTGTCAALAAKSAAEMLFSGNSPQLATLTTPKGIEVSAEVACAKIHDNCAECSIQKDAGDDFDVTDGMMITATVHKTDSEITVDGGEGVGRVTRRGLEQKVGDAAINRVPREMILTETAKIAQKFGYCGGLHVVISVNAGAEIAQKTFNPNLGIVGGISILGTSGIVEPQSVQALIDSIRIEMKMLAENNIKNIIVTPGNYGEDFLKTYPNSEKINAVKCSNFIGDTLDFAQEFQFSSILLVGHIGKFVKLAGGIMNTHSHSADCRAEIFSAHAAQQGASQDTVCKLMNSVTTDECIEILDSVGLRETVLGAIAEKIGYHIKRRAGNVHAECIIFSNVHGLLAKTDGADERLKTMGGNNE